MSSKEQPGRKAHKGIAMEGFVAKQYDRIQKHMIEEYKLWAKLVSDNIAPGSNILEIAPGPGYLSVEIAKLGNYNIIGLDISRTFVEIAQKKAREAGVKIDFRQGDAAEIPFSNENFDFAVCTSAFKNFPDPVKVLDEIFRVLKTSAKAVIIDMNKDAPKARLNEFVDRMKLNMFDSYFTKQTFKGLAKSAYSLSEIQHIVQKSEFKQCQFIDEEIGFEVWLTRAQIISKS
jgi:ubiquinone/menaquinone biosynthesis C-methylase UbiE